MTAHQQEQTHRGAIVIGATSGIGEGVAQALRTMGYTVGVAGRRAERLAAMQMPHRVMDITQTEQARQALRELIAEVGHVELFVLSAGVGNVNKTLDWQLEAPALLTNVVGTAAMATLAFDHLCQQGYGTLAIVSSVAGMRGLGLAPAYTASKGFDRLYAEALSAQARQRCPNVHIVDIRPGFIDTPLIAGNTYRFGVVPVHKATRQITRAITRQRPPRVLYVSRRWRWAAYLLRCLPHWVIARFS